MSDNGNNKSAPSICGGPIDANGKCLWCKRKARAGGVYGGARCAWPHPKRPRRRVHPQMVKLVVRGMVCQCWQCGSKHPINEIQHREVVDRFYGGEEVSITCLRCGHGIDMLQSLLVSARR